MIKNYDKSIDEKLEMLKALLKEVEIKEDESRSCLYNEVKHIYKFPQDFFFMAHKAIDKCTKELSSDLMAIRYARERLAKKNEKKAGKKS